MKNENQVRGIERQITKINMELHDLKTNHILHLILTVLTIPAFGLWALVWAVCALSNANERSKLKTRQAQLETQLDLLWEGI